MHTVLVEWLQVFTIVAALLGIVGLQTTWVIHALERLEARVDMRFDAVDARFAQVDARFAQVDARFEQLESKLDARIDALDVKLTGKIATLHWMFGTTVAMFAALFVQQFFSR